MTPSPPDRAIIWIVDKDSHPCEKAKQEDAYMWTWEGAEKWYYVKEFPSPKPQKDRRKANTQAIWTGYQWRYT